MKELLLPIAHALRLRLNEKQRREEDDLRRVELDTASEATEPKPTGIVVIDLT